MPVSLEATSSRTLGGAVYASVRSEILAGRYAPGSKLSPRRIAAQFEVSLSVVREALTRLTEQGLVVAEPQVGFSVFPLDMEDLKDLTRTRILIEVAALREAIENADVEYETAVVAAHHRMSRTTYWKDEDKQIITDEWASAHSRFHAALLSASPSPRLRDLAGSLRDTSELYRRWAGPFASGERTRDVEGEHRALVDAVLKRDGDGASAILTVHINTTTALLAAYQSRQDEKVCESGTPALETNVATSAELDQSVG